MAQKIIERVEAHYEVPFGKVYEWRPAYVVLECECGEKSILTATSTTFVLGAPPTSAPSSTTSNNE
jgi:hypothetical protein